MKNQIARYDALVEILAQPDPPDLLPRRGHHYTFDRDLSRNPNEIKRALGVAYVEHRRHDYGLDVSTVLSVRRRQLRMVKHA